MNLEQKNKIKLNAMKNLNNRSIPTAHKQEKRKMHPALSFRRRGDIPQVVASF
jgi:hypothetical protein